EIPVVGIEIPRITSPSVVGVGVDADAVGPGVVRADVHSAGSAALNRKQHAMIILRARIFSREQVSVVLSLHWILQDRPATLVRVSGRGARPGRLQDIALSRAAPVHRTTGAI